MKRRKPSAAIGTIVIERMPDYALLPKEAESGHIWEVLREEQCYKTILGSALSREDAELLAETERAFA